MSKQEFELEMTLTIRPKTANGGYSHDRLTLSDTVSLGQRTLPEVLHVMADLDAAIRQPAAAGVDGG